MKNNLKETIVIVCLVVVAILLLNPFNFWMPSIMVMSMLLVALVLFGIFTSFILREKNLDEREGAHRTLAGRNAFLAGSATLLIAICVQELSSNLDPWIVIAFLAMILAKVTTRIWSDKNL